MGQPEHFVVRATGAIGTYWFSEPNDKGLRLLVPRERAAVFQSLREAGLAIDKMRRGLQDCGIVFVADAIPS